MACPSRGSVRAERDRRASALSRALARARSGAPARAISRALSRAMSRAMSRAVSCALSRVLSRAQSALLAGALSAAPIAVAQAAVPQPTPQLVLCVSDAATGAPVPFAQVAWRARPETDAGPRTRLSAACALLPHAPATGAELLVTRLGFAPQVVSTQGVPPRTNSATPQTSNTTRYATPTAARTIDTLHIALVPIAASLPAVAVRASGGLARRSTTPLRGAGISVTLDTDSARAMGAASTGAVTALLPYTAPRSARGDVSLSLRGARREQVVVTLDGIPLNDPATGLADLADIPLVALGSATVAPGSDPLGAGPGAAGGVLALSSGTRTIGVLRSGAWGQQLAEGAWQVNRGDVRLRLGGSWQRSDNNFPFVNTASTTGTERTERRVNNDVRRGSAIAHLDAPRFRLTALLSDANTGLVGPVNVRAYDNDRALTRRLFLHGTGAPGAATLLSGSVRGFTLGYRDPVRPGFDSDARAIAADIDVRRDQHGFALRAGAGGDGIRTTTNVRQERARAFVAATRAEQALGWQWVLGARADAIGGSGVLPSFSIGAERAAGPLTLGARLAQAVRVPTLYDLYFASPQRLQVRALQPERVTLDAEWTVRAQPVARDNVTLAFETALVARDVRNAIVWFPGNFGWSPENVGVERLRGVEARTTLTVPHLSLSAWGTRYASTLRSGGLRIPTPYVPDVAGGAVATTGVAGTYITAASRFMGTRPFTAGPRDPAFLLPAVAIADFIVARRQTLGAAELLFSVSLDNAFNRAWQSVRGFPSPGRTWAAAITISPSALP